MECDQMESKQCIEKFADDILCEVCLSQDIKEQAKIEFISICEKNQPKGKKKAMMALCIHNVNIRLGYYISLERICDLLEIDNKNLSAARKYFRMKGYKVENENFEAILKDTINKMNIQCDSVNELSRSILYYRAKNPMMDKFMLRSLAIGILYIISSCNVDMHIWCKEMNISYITLKSVINELQKIEFLKK